MNANLPPYPVQYLPARFRAYIDYLCDRTQTPVELVAPVVISAAAAAVQPLLDVEMPYGAVVPTGLYVLQVVTSGDRATAVLREVKKPFEEAELGLSNPKPSVASLFDNPPTLPSKHPPTPQILVEKSSDHGIVELLSAGSYSLFHILEEAGLTLNRMSFPAPCKRWDGDTERHNTRELGAVVLRDRRTSMCLVIQKLPFDRFMAKRGDLAVESGFLPRTLISFPSSNQGYRRVGGSQNSQPQVFEERQRELLRRYQSSLRSGTRDRLVARFDTHARAVWERLEQLIEYELRPTGGLSDVRSFGAKAGQNAARIAAGLQYHETDSAEIEVWAAEAGAHIAAWHLEVSKWAFGTIPPERQLQVDAHALLLKLQEWRMKGFYRVPKSFLLRNAPAHLRHRDALDPVLWLLRSSGHINISYERRMEIISLAAASLPYTAALGS